MAVLSKFEVTVLVNGEKAQEFDDAGEDEAEEETVVKYIEAITDATFSFEFVFHPGYNPGCHYLSFYTYIDGQYARGRMIRRSEFPKKWSRICARASLDHVWSKNGDQWARQGFKFSDISFRQQIPGDKDDVKSIAQAGTFRVEVWRHRLTHNTRARGGSHEFSPQLDMSEKDTKGQAISHAANLDSPKPTDEAPGKVVRGKRIDTKPLAVFIFKYRSKKALQDLMILPRSPSPPPPLEERLIDSLTVEEMRELLTRHRAEAEASTRVKREREEDTAPSTSSAPNSKRPRGDPSSSQVFKSDGEFEYSFSRSVNSTADEPINLTDD